jgi:sulfofructose kinase
MASVFCIGHAVQDYIFTLDRMPSAPTKYKARGFARAGGGPAATAAVAIARLGGKARLAARVGDDPVADEIIAELIGEGVDCNHVRRFKGRASALSAVMIDAMGERMIVSHADPEMPRDASWLPERLPPEIGGVLGDTRWPEGAARMFGRARAAGIAAILDGDAAYSDDGAHFAASHIAFSVEGLKHFAPEGETAARLKSAQRRTGAWCCVTEGPRGVLIDDGGAQRRLPAFEVKAIDTLGAGDVWHGAFALALAEGRDEIAAATFASAAAAIKVTQPGGRAGAPHRSEVEAFLAKRAP